MDIFSFTAHFGTEEDCRIHFKKEIKSLKGSLLLILQQYDKKRIYVENYHENLFYNSFVFNLNKKSLLSRSKRKKDI